MIKLWSKEAHLTSKQPQGLTTTKDVTKSLGTWSEKKRDYVGKIPKLGGGGLTQTHFLMSTYQVIFGMPK